MLLAIVMQAQAPQSAVAVERMFAADASVLGQKGAFEKWAARDAVMLLPQTTSPTELINNEPNAPISWWPTASYVSCDGKLAVNTGGWRRVDGVGYFTTVWRREPGGGWRWIVNAGGTLRSSRPGQSNPTVTRATCLRRGEFDPPFHMFHTPPPSFETGVGQSPDGTLHWGWQRQGGGWQLTVTLRGFGEVIADGMPG